MSDPSSHDSGHSIERRLQAAALLLASSALLSRLLGYARDAIIAYRHGASSATDVYLASFTIPDLLNYLLAGGAFSATLLPRLSRAIAAGREGDADRIVSVVGTTMLALFGSLALLVAWQCEWLVRLIVPGFTPEQVTETVRLTRIVLPAQLFFYTGGLVQASLLARQRFNALALEPLIYNAGIIGGGLGLGPWLGIEGFSWGALGGAALGALVLPLWKARDVLRPKFVWAPTDPEVRAFFYLALPLMIGVSLTTVDEWFGRAFGSTLAVGSITWLNNARRLMLVPIGVVGQASGQATGPFIARLYSEGRHDEVRAVLERALTSTVVISLLVAAGFVALAEPAVGVVFERGQFRESDTIQAASALRVYAPSIAAWGAQALLARAFYAVGSTWTPMLASTGVTVVWAIVYWFAKDFGVAGLAFAGASGMFAQATVLGVLAHRRFGFAARPVLLGGARALVAASVACVAAWLASEALALDALGRTGSLFARALVGGLAWLPVTIVGARLLGVPGLPIDALMRRLRLRGP